MQIVVLYLATATVFLAADAAMLSRVIAPLFERHLGDQLLDSPRILPAALFYLAYVGVLLYFVSLPALREDMPVRALLNGALLGFLAYGTYEFTNLATLRAWHWQQVAVDLTWGTVLTAGSAWAGVMVARALG